MGIEREFSFYLFILHSLATYFKARPPLPKGQSDNVHTFLPRKENCFSLLLFGSALNQAFHFIVLFFTINIVNAIIYGSIEN